MDNRKNSRALCHGCFLGKRIFVNMKEINDLCHCCNNPGEDIKQIQGRNSFKVGKYSVDPDNTEYAGSHAHRYHGILRIPCRPRKHGIRRIP